MQTSTQNSVGLTSDLSAELDSLLEMATDYLSAQKESRLSPCNPDFLIKNLAIVAKKYRDFSEEQAYALDTIEKIAVSYTVDTCGEVQETIDIVSEINKVKNRI